jgi:hypothetical protein
MIIAMLTSLGVREEDAYKQVRSALSRELPNPRELLPRGCALIYLPPLL